MWLETRFAGTVDLNSVPLCAAWSGHLHIEFLQVLAPTKLTDSRL